MALVKLSVVVTLFAVLYQISDYVYPVISWFSNLAALMVISWFGGKYLTKRFVLPRLPKVNPKGKAVLVTGCDTGFGHLSAIEFNRYGFHVFAGCLKADGQGAKELKDKVVYKDALTVVQMDVTNEDQIRDSFKIVEDYLKDSTNQVEELFALVNNAGVMFCGGVEMYEPPKVDDFKLQMDINGYGMVRVTRMFTPLIRRSRGRIVNITSIVARLAVGGTVAYSCSKALAAKFTEFLQVELNRFGVTVVGIEPWAVRTNLLLGKQIKESIQINWSKATEEVRRSYTEALYKRQQELLDFFVNFPYNTTTDMVVGAIKEAVTSYEPDTNYRVMISPLDWILWFINEMPPWDLRVFLRNTSDWLLEKFA